jgi:hypothetical protein
MNDSMELFLFALSFFLEWYVWLISIDDYLKNLNEQCLVDLKHFNEQWLVDLT